MGGKKSATLLVPFQAVCWDMSFVSVRPIDASGLTPLTLCEALVLVFPPEGKKMFAMFIYVATPDKCLYFFAGQEL